MKPSHAIDLFWRLAVQEALTARREFLEPEHFLEALTKGRECCREDVMREVDGYGIHAEAMAAELSLVADVLEGAGINPTDLRRAVRGLAGMSDHEHREGEIIHRSERSRTLFALAEKMSADWGMPGVHAGMLFAAILAEKDSIPVKAIEERGGDPAKLKTEVFARIGLQENSPLRAKASPHGDACEELPDGSILGKFGRDLTKAAREGLLSPVIGRRKEILQVLQTLARSTKSNPVLVGDPGVGKTAIVEALAQRIVDGKDEQVLGGKRIVEISMGALVAGTKYRGEFEDRLKKLLAEATADPNLILFIDEIHTMIGAGDRSGGLDAANLMKPALARGEIKCIGATTIDEYRKHIETDAALERRFDKIIVPEPSRDETIQILEGLRQRFEGHHGTSIGDSAIQAAVDLSIRFDAGHRLPDKAIDLLDLACAQRCVPELSMQRVGGGDGRPAHGEVTSATVIAVLAEKTGIPADVIAGDVGQGEQSKWAGLKERLHERVIGQDDAIERTCNRLMLAQVGLGERRGPLGVFLFLGPSGVGKTELARALTEELFGEERHLIRLDMSEYMEQHSVSRLIGSPPGYVGYEEEGQLTGKLRSMPYSIVLLDEVEKAHARVFDLFLQIFDDGRLTDAKGRTVDARNAIFIMTSNIGGVEQRKSPQLGFNADPSKDIEQADTMLAELKKHFRIELINRIDEVIRFQPLTAAVMGNIARKMLDELIVSVQQKYHVNLECDDAVISILCGESHCSEFGARKLNRVIQQLIETPLVQLLVQKRDHSLTGIRCVVEQDVVVLRINH